MFIYCSHKDPENSKRKAPIVDYEELAKPRSVNTRSNDNVVCGCSICQVGRLSGQDYKKYEADLRQKTGRPRLTEPEEAEAVAMCTYCHTEVGQGRPHECTRTEMQENLFDLVRNKSEKTQEQVTSKLLDAIYQNKGVSKQGGVAILATKGAPKQVMVGKSRNAKPSPKFTLEDMTKLQVSRNLSDKDTLAVASFIRVKAGRDAVQPNLKKALTDRNHELKDMFYKKEMVMKLKPKKKKDKQVETDSEEDESVEDALDGSGYKNVLRPGIFVKDVDEFTQFLVDERSLDPHDHIVQFGFDDGQGILKIMEIVKSNEVYKEQETTRSKYADGVCPKTSKLSSVKKMFVVGLIPDVQEIYPNVKAMLDELDLQGIEFGFSADIKIYLCIIGKQVASCTHPCVYCEGKAPWEKTYEPLTIGSLFDWHQKYLDSGAKKSTAKKFQNVVNKPLLTGEDSLKTLEVLNPPQLHIMTGVMGKLLTEMEKVTGEQFVTNFLREEDISKCVYQGSRSFEGNQARKFLKNVDKLEREVMKLDMETSISALPFVQALRLFDKVVSSCFGQILDPEYETNIRDFSEQYRSLGISVTPKVNIVSSKTFNSIL